MSKGAVKVQKGSKVIVRHTGQKGVVRSFDQYNNGRQGRPFVIALIQTRNEKGHFNKELERFSVRDLELI